MPPASPERSQPVSKLGALLQPLLAFQPPLPSKSLAGDTSRTGAEELIRLASRFMMALAAVPRGLHTLQAQVDRVLDTLKPGTPLRAAVDAIDTLLERKIQVASEADAQRAASASPAPAKRKGAPVRQVACLLGIADKTLIDLCHAVGIYVTDRHHWIDADQERRLTAELNQHFPLGRKKSRPDRDARDFARQLGLEVRVLLKVCRRLGIEVELGDRLEFQHQAAVIFDRLKSKSEIKVFELAYELSIEKQDVIEVCQRLGISVKNQLSSLTLAEQNAIKERLKAENEGRLPPAGRTNRPARSELEAARSQVAAVQRWLDCPVPPLAGEQLSALADQCGAALPAVEDQVLVSQLRDAAANLIRLARREHFPGSRFLCECHEAAGDRQRLARLVDYCTDLSAVTLAVQEAAEALCLSLNEPSPAEPLAPYVFRVDPNDNSRFHVRFQTEQGPIEEQFYPRRRGLEIVHDLLHYPNPPKPRSAVEVLEGHEAATRAERSYWNEEIASIAAAKKARERYQALQASTGQRALEERDANEQLIRNSVQNPDAFLSGAEPVLKLIGKTTEATAKDLIRNHFKLACELLIDKMPKLVEHLKRTVPPKPKQHWAYRPDRHIPWQLD